MAKRSSLIDASRALVLAGFSIFWMGSAALAQEATPQGPQPAPQSECSFPCLFRSAPTAQPEPARQPTADAGVPAPDPTPTVPKAAPKPVVHALTIAAAEPEAARLRALTGVLRGQPVKIVTISSPGSASLAADFAVTTVLQPAGEPAKAPEAKLFTEQLHVIAGAKIARIEDLRDRVVSFGVEGSPGQDAGRKAFRSLGITVKETPLDLDNALDGAATGDIDAVIVLAPQPFERLKSVARSGLHLLTWPDSGPIPEGASVTTIESDRYPGLAAPGESIRAVAVDAVLRVSAKGAKLPVTKRFLSALAQHSAALSKRGFDLLKADLDQKTSRRVATNDRR